jgi:PAS domain S-box-containing protein
VQVKQRYAILSLLQAILGAVIAAASVVSYRLSSSSPSDGSLTITIAGIGVVAALYYLSVHQILKSRQLELSSLILSLITALNIILVVLATGGLDSPYYALWLLAIVIAGLFGGLATAVAVAGTLAIYATEFALHRTQSSYLAAHLGQLAITVATGGVAEWIHVTLGRGAAQHQQVKVLSGQLNQEALKSNVLMQSVGEGVMVVNTTRQIQLFNPAASTITGWDEDSAQNIDYRLVLNLHDTAGNKLDDKTDPLNQVWQEEKSLVRNDLTIETKGGRKMAVSLSLSPIFSADHKVSGSIVLFRDISQEKEVERQRNEFISTASHEMRTPVAAVEGYLSLAMNPAVATIDARAKGYLEKAHSSTQHLGKLFQDLLSITKLEDQAKVDAQEIFDLTALVQEAVSDMQFSAQKKGLELQFGLAGESVRGGQTVMPVYAVKGNPQRLREVVMNLIENAIKFTGEGSIHVSIGGIADKITVSVTDTGIGIAPEDISHLFQKFYRIDSTATRTIGGTGLGLYLCRTIVELLGGRIWIESKLGEGSSFKFSLPRQDSNKIAVAPALTPNPAPTPAPTTVPAPQPATAVAKSIPIKTAALAK